MKKLNKNYCEYWNSGYKQGGWNYPTKLIFDRFLKDVKKKKKKKVLEVGCGKGELMQYFKEKGAIVKGVDISQNALNYARSKGLDVIQTDCRNLPFKDNSFDIVYSIGVVEHFDETLKAIEEHRRVCKPNGKIIIIVPNRTFSYLGCILFNLKWCLKAGLLITCGKTYTKKTLKRLLIKAKCKNIKILAYANAFLVGYEKLTNQPIIYSDNSWYERHFGHLLFSISEKE